MATSRSFSQGCLQQGSNPRDVAVSGIGFLDVQMPDGTTGYTRDGSPCPAVCSPAAAGWAPR